MTESCLRFCAVKQYLSNVAEQSGSECLPAWPHTIRLLHVQVLAYFGLDPQQGLSEQQAQQVCLRRDVTCLLGASLTSRLD